jgi:predicted acylesterase/phospholipase RssA
MKHLGISGGGTKISGLFHAAEIMIREKNYVPDIISGISAGALLSVPLALAMKNEARYDLIRARVNNITMEDFFSDTPINPDGKPNVINAAIKILEGKYYLGTQDNLERTLTEVVPEADFNEYKASPECPICIVGAVDFYTGGRVYMNLKEVEYKDFPKFVNGSGSIPIYTAGIKVDEPFTTFDDKDFEKAFLFDGGVRDHSPTAKILSVYKNDITNTCTIYSRPENYQNCIDDPDFDPGHLLEVLQRYVDISLVEISKNDEYMEKKIAEDYGIIYHDTIFLPWIMKHIYDIDPARLQLLTEKAIELANAWNWEGDLPA